MGIQEQFKIRVLYKSGNSHCFWCSKFNYTTEGVEYQAVSSSDRPLTIGFDNIEAIYQVDSRTKTLGSMP